MNIGGRKELKDGKDRIDYGGSRVGIMEFVGLELQRNFLWLML